jgi:hypothetical protein
MNRAWVIKNISKQAYPRASMSKMRLIILAIWSAAVAASIAPLMGWNRYIYEVWCFALCDISSRLICIQDIDIAGIPSQ